FRVLTLGGTREPASRVGVADAGGAVPGVPAQPAAAAAVYRPAARAGGPHFRQAQALRHRRAARRLEAGRPAGAPGDRLPHAREARGSGTLTEDRARAADGLRPRLRLPGARAPDLPRVWDDDRVPAPGDRPSGAGGGG